MSEKILFKPQFRKRTVELSYEERAVLNSVIDLIIPADEHFPPPSSLHLIDNLLHHLIPDAANHINLVLNEKRLHCLLHDLNAAADGDFCKLSLEAQKWLLNRLEKREPVIFQALWTLVNHSYYAHLATKNQPVSFASQ